MAVHVHMNICTYNDEDSNTNRTKNSQNSGSIRVQPSIPTYKRCFIKSKCINKESHLVFDKDLLSKHACTHFHILQGQEQPRFAFAFCPWCECYHTNRMWDFPTRITTEKRENGRCVGVYTQKLRNSSHIQICQVISGVERNSPP